jgi:hypothetical protein
LYSIIYHSGVAQSGMMKEYILSCIRILLEYFHPVSKVGRTRHHGISEDVIRLRSTLQEFQPQMVIFWRAMSGKGRSTAALQK